MPETACNSQIDLRGNLRRGLKSSLRKRVASPNIYLKRDPQRFFGNLSIAEQQELLERLELSYSRILFDYFSSEEKIDRLINHFAEEAFSVDLPLHKVVEIHGLLIDNLNYQLKIEGIHTEYLSDFRLTLIDVVAHLSEIYRKVLVNAECLARENLEVKS